MAYYDTEQKEKQAKLDKEAKLEKIQNIADMQKLLRFPEFRRFCWRKLSEAGIFRATFSNNAMAMSFAEGTRNSGLSLLSDLNEADPNAFAQIQSQHIAEQKVKEEVEQKEREDKNAKP